MRRAMLLSALVLFTAANAGAQGTPVCSLLTAGEVGGVGATGEGIPGEMDTMKMCSWRLPAGGLHVSVARVPPGMSRDAVVAELNKNYAALTAQGWTEERKDFGPVSCLLMTPPAGQHDAPATTSCLGVAKGMMVSAATLTKTRIPMETLKALVDSAAGRL